MRTSIDAEEWLAAANIGNCKALKQWKREGRLRGADFERLAALRSKNKNNALQMAIDYGYDEYAKLLVKLGWWPESINSDYQSTLALAVINNMGDMVQALIDMGHTTRTRRGQAGGLMNAACRDGCAQAGLVLLANGVKTVAYENLCDLVGKTTLRASILDRGIRIYPGAEIELLDGLLAAGMDPNWTDDGAPQRSCLQEWCLAIERREHANEFHVEILQVLLKYGADTEQRVEMRSKGLHLPGTSWLGRENGLQEFLREHKARMCQNAMDQAVAEPCAIGATTRRM